MAATFSKRIEDKRQYRRILAHFHGRFLSERTRQEHECQIANISLDGVFVRTATQAIPIIGERVILYVDNLGRFEGRVRRAERLGFGISMLTSQRLRKKLEAQLLWLSKLSQKAVKELRAYPRIIPRNLLVQITTASGLQTSATLIDISRGGASFVGSTSYKVGERIVLGRVPGRIVGANRDRIVVSFLEPLPIAGFDESITL